MAATWRYGRRGINFHTNKFEYRMFWAALILLLIIICCTAGAPANAQTLAPVSPAAASSQVNFQMQVTFPKIEQRRPLKTEIYHGAILFEAKIAGRSAWGLFDNGSNLTLIDTTFAKSAGLDVGPRVEDVRTMGGAQVIKPIGSVDIELPGQFNFKISPQFSADLSQLTDPLGRPVSLIIGKDLFDQFLFGFGVSEQTFQMGQSGTFRPPPEAFELNLVNDPPQIDVVINGRAASLKVVLGDSSIITLSDAAWARLGIDKLTSVSGKGMALDGAKSLSLTKVVDEVSVGPLKFHQLTVSRASVVQDQSDGRIGMGFFSGFNFVIDQKAHRIWLYNLPTTRRAPAQGDKDGKVGPTH